MKTAWTLIGAGALLVIGAHTAWRNQIDWGLRECCNAGSIGPDLLMFGVPFVVGAVLLLIGSLLAVVRAGRPRSRLP